MKQFFIFLFAFIGYQSLYSQPGQIALVKPDGTTTIHSTFQSAYEVAEDGDYVYLPGGGNINIGVINKKLYIYGAGTFIDSCSTTRITNVNNFTLDIGAAGGSIEGVQINGFLSIKCNYFIVSNCKITNGISVDFNISNNLFKNNVIGVDTWMSSINSNSGGILKNSLFVNNFIQGSLSNNLDSIFVKNNIFFRNNVNLANYSTYENNIFLNGTFSFNSIFKNNVNITVQNNEYYNYYSNNFDEPWMDIFINSGDNTFDFHNDYHVKATSQCHNSGTDGTDRGIYGGDFPWVEGSVPSNPHIYYKSVGAGTNANGLLQIHFKVRTND